VLIPRGLDANFSMYFQITPLNGLGATRTDKGTVNALPRMQQN